MMDLSHFGWNENMIELLLIRHGETAWNAERRLQGHVDIALNEIGLQQAEALARALNDEPVDIIMCSDLQRAKQTADAIARNKNLLYQIVPTWRERCFGGFEGELIYELQQRFPSEYAAWRTYDADSQFPINKDGKLNGESLRQFHTRIEHAFVELSHRFNHKKIALVVHGGVLECAYRIAHQLPLTTPCQKSIFNASINRFELSTNDNQIKLKLVQWGDVTHLDNALDELTSCR